MVQPVRLAVDDLLHVLVYKQLQDQGDVVGVEKQLRQVFKLQDVWSALSALENQTTARITYVKS